MSERVREIDWNLVAKEGSTSFDLFVQYCLELGERDPRWSVKFNPKEQKKKNCDEIVYTLEAKYKEDGNSSEIEIGASMFEFPSRGILVITAHESWEFRFSKEVGTHAAETIVELLQKAELQAIPLDKRHRGGRDSYWRSDWKIYPSSHPKVSVR